MMLAFVLLTLNLLSCPTKASNEPQINIGSINNAANNIAESGYRNTHILKDTTPDIRKDATPQVDTSDLISILELQNSDDIFLEVDNENFSKRNFEKSKLPGSDQTAIKSGLENSSGVDSPKPKLNEIRLNSSMVKTILESMNVGDTLESSGSEILVMKARFLNDRPTDYYHNPIYDYKGHGPIERTIHAIGGSSYNDGQSSYDKGHHKEDGHKAEYSHGGTAGHSDSAQGSHGVNVKESGHSVDSSKISDGGHQESYGGGSKDGVVAEKGHETGEKGHVSKGHNEEGFNNLHRVVEYGYSETYGDEEGDGGYHSSYDAFDGHHGAGEQGGYSGGKFKDDGSHSSFRTSGQDHAGSYHDHQDEDISKYGQNSNYGNKFGFGEHQGQHDYKNGYPYDSNFDRLKDSSYPYISEDSSKYDHPDFRSDFGPSGYSGSSSPYDSEGDPFNKYSGYNSEPYSGKTKDPYGFGSSGSYDDDEDFPHSKVHDFIDSKFRSSLDSSFPHSSRISGYGPDSTLYRSDISGRK